MNTSRLLRISLLAAALGAALSAQAVTIGLTSSGTTADVGFNNNELVLQQIGGYGPLTALTTNLFANANALGGIYSGTGIYTGGGGTLSFAFDLAPATINSTVSYSGAWTMTAGTGTYANKTGLGTLTMNFFDQVNSPNLNVFTTFSGDLQAVPEPASMAAVGVSALGLLRRRRKA